MGITIGVVTGSVMVILSLLFWDDLGVLRNLVLIWGTPLAILLAVWRSIVAQKQVEATQAGLLAARYQRAVEMLGSEKDFIRIGGIHTLRDLAREHSKVYLLEARTLLNAYNVTGLSMLRNEKLALEEALLEILRTDRGWLYQFDHWWRRLRIWIEELCKRS